MNKLKEIAKVIKKAKSIALFMHISPDYDALASSFALYYTMKKMNKVVEIFSKDKLNSTQKKIFDETIINNKSCKRENFDLFICSDVSSLNRLGDYSNIFTTKDKTIIIDHHVCNEEIGYYNYINNNRSSCSEIIFDLLKLLPPKLDLKIATLLYAGLSSDTASFINSNTNEFSLSTAYNLTKMGVNINQINQILYETRTLKEIDFKKYLWNNYKIKKDCAYCLMDYDTLKMLKGKKSDCISYSKSLISIENINYSFSIVEEKKGEYNLSMRSKIGFDVRKVAEKVGGGGHICAAGAKFQAKNINEASKIILDNLYT